MGSRPALVCRALEPLAVHLMTTRAWELGDAAGRDEHRAWSEVAAAMSGRLARIHQVHGAHIVVRRRGDSPGAKLPAADIIVSDDPEVALAVQAADCVPILIADRRTGAVAAAHAGWRGLAAGVPRAAVGALAREFGSRPADLVAAAGPSIGACCYEVGSDVRRRFEEAGWPASAIGRWFFPRPHPTTRNPSMAGVPAVPRPGHWYFDSGGATRDQLEAAGAPREQIFVSELCTASHPGAFCSYRRDGMNAGRMAAAIRARGNSVALIMTTR